MADIIESGVHHVFHHHEPGYSVADLKEPVGVGLDAIAHGMLCAFPDDTENLKASMALYDGLYMYCRSVLLLREKPELGKLLPPALWDRQREALGRTKRSLMPISTAGGPRRLNGGGLRGDAREILSALGKVTRERLVQNSPPVGGDL